MRFGNREKTVLIYIVGLLPFLILIYINKIAVFKEGEMIPFWYTLLLIMGCFIQFIAILWIIAKVSGNRTPPLMDDAGPEEVVTIRVTKDGIIVPLFAPKGRYGKAETVCYGSDADFMDTGDFPLRTIGGSPAIIVFDMLNTSMDLRRSVARKYMKKHVENGVDGYKIWKRKKSDINEST
jgi:hypothetical protein